MSEIEDLYHIAWKFVDDQLNEGRSPLEVAACLSVVALSIYRSALDEDDYNRIVDKISESRDKAHVLRPSTLN